MSDGSDALIVAATSDDVAHFARRRTDDEHAYRLYTDLAHEAPAGAWVAKDAGDVVGIAFAHALEDEWFLSELFVEPSLRARGIGRALLAEASQDAGEVTRSAVVPSGELGNCAFFAQRRIALQTPLLRVSGSIPREEELARMAAGDYHFAVRDLDPVADRAALGALDRELRGSARGDDHLYFAEHARGVAFLLRGEFVGYAYMWPSGRIGPLAASSPAYLTQFLAFALVTLQQSGASWCTVLVPGVNVRLLRTAMIAGLRIEGLDLFASDAPLLDLSRYVGFHPLLF